MQFLSWASRVKPPAHEQRKLPTVLRQVPCVQRLGKALHSFTSVVWEHQMSSNHPDRHLNSKPVPEWCPLPILWAPSAQTHLYRRAGLTGSPCWQSPSRGDTGW